MLRGYCAVTGLTYGREAPEGGEIVEGTWWAPDYQGPPLVSFDAEIAVGWISALAIRLRLMFLGVRSRRPSPICAKSTGRRASQFRHGFFAGANGARAAYLSHYGNHDAEKKPI